MGISKRDKKEVIKWVKEFTYWDKLRSVQNSKIISSTYVWLFAVPILAKFLSKINDSISFTFDKKVYEFILKMPFSWELFFYSSLFFVLGNIIFIVLSPELIKDFKDYGEFTGSGRTINHLQRYKTEKYKEFLNYTQNQERNKTQEYKIIIDHIRSQGGQENPTGDDGKFWHIYNYLNRTYAKYI